MGDTGAIGDVASDENTSAEPDLGLIKKNGYLSVRYYVDESVYKIEIYAFPSKPEDASIGDPFVHVFERNIEGNFIQTSGLVGLFKFASVQSNNEVFLGYINSYDGYHGSV